MSTKVKDQPRRKYDDEFKRQALQMIANGQAVRSVAQASRRRRAGVAQASRRRRAGVAQALGVGENLLHKWKHTARTSESSDDLEVAELRARLRQVEQERDILKKALGIFSRQT